MQEPEHLLHREIFQGVLGRYLKVWFESIHPKSNRKVTFSRCTNKVSLECTSSSTGTVNSRYRFFEFVLHSEKSRTNNFPSPRVHTLCSGTPASESNYSPAIFNERARSNELIARTTTTLYHIYSERGKDSARGRESGILENGTAERAKPLRSQATFEPKGP